MPSGTWRPGLAEPDTMAGAEAPKTEGAYSDGCL